jgi:hypothetical protein
MDFIYALAVTFVGAFLFLAVDRYEDDAMVANLLKFLVLIFTALRSSTDYSRSGLRGFRPQSGRHLTFRMPLVRNAASSIARNVNTVWREADRTLGHMEKMLAQMEADYAGAQERSAQATTDEKSLRSFERDTPM